MKRLAPSTGPILIVEDEAIVAADIIGRLQRLGYATVGPAASGSEALDFARHSAPALAVMDIRLQGAMDGIMVANSLREELDIPVVFLTAHADEATLERAQVTESFGYLLKPFDERMLDITIAMAIYKHRMESERRQLTRDLEVALTEVKTLRGLLSVCCRCSRIEDETGHWARMERYVAKRTHASFSHTFCPECAVTFYEEAGLRVPDEVLAERAKGRFDL